MEEYVLQSCDMGDIIVLPTKKVWNKFITPNLHRITYKDIAYPQAMCNTIDGKYGKVILCEPSSPAIMVALQDGTRWWIHKEFLYASQVDLNKKNKSPTVECVLCHKKSFVTSKIKKNYNKFHEFICPNCSATKGYGTKNKSYKHKPVKKGITYGFEFECKPNSRDDILNIISPRYGFIPTEDCSLPSNGVEFKSPIYNSLIGVNAVLNMLDASTSCSDRAYGTHINIGHKDYNVAVKQRVFHYADYIFNPLKKYMLENREETERFCGRYFCRYASPTENRSDFICHSSFINLAHDDRIEFRISKYRNTKQFMRLMAMWGAVMQNIISWSKRTPTACHSETDTAKMVASATELGNIILNTYKKYLIK